MITTQKILDKMKVQLDMAKYYPEYKKFGVSLILDGREKELKDFYITFNPNTNNFEMTVWTR